MNCEIAGCENPKRSAHPSTKYCESCRKTVNLQHGRAYYSKNKDSRAEYGREYRRHPEFSLRQRTRAHGITVTRYFVMLAAQGCACAICGTDAPGGHGSWHIDHDHSCCAGATSCGHCVRGLLCSSCNTGIGLLGDDPERLAAARQYLLDSR